jgi:hypothetical protein
MYNINGSFFSSYDDVLGEAEKASKSSQDPLTPRFNSMPGGGPEGASWRRSLHPSSVINFEQHDQLCELRDPQTLVQQ